MIYEGLDVIYAGCLKLRRLQGFEVIFEGLEVIYEGSEVIYEGLEVI